MKEKLLKIRNFGNDQLCDDLDDVFRTLSKRYKGKSVAVEVVGAESGMSMSFFIDVDEDGAVSESYGVMSDKSDLSVRMAEAMELGSSEQEVANGS